MNLVTNLFFRKIELSALQTLYDHNIRSVAKQIGTKIYLPEHLVYSENNFFNIDKNSFFSRNLFQQELKYYMDSKYDVLLSYFTLSSLNVKERIDFLNNIQQIAPKTIFIDYEVPEHNITYLGYYCFTMGEYANIRFGHTYESQSKKDRIQNYSNFLKKGALEGFFYDLEKDYQISPKVIERKSIGLGGVGLYFCEW